VAKEKQVKAWSKNSVSRAVEEAEMKSGEIDESDSKAPKCKYHVRYATGKRKFAASNSKPMVTLVAEEGEVRGQITPPGKGHSKVTAFMGHAGIGEITKVLVSADNRDGWFFTSFEFKACAKGSKWVRVGCTHQWLDGKPYDKKGDNAPYSNEITLRPETHGRCKMPTAVVKVVTGDAPYANSNQKPRVTLVGEGGTYTGRISLPRTGRSKMTVFKLAKDIGVVKTVHVQASSIDGWLMDSFEVQTTPKGKDVWQEFGCTDRWLDKKPYDTAPYHMPYADKFPLQAAGKGDVCKAKFPKGWKRTKKGCFCAGKGKYGKCKKWTSTKSWCATRDACGRYSAGYGMWDYCG